MQLSMRQMSKGNSEKVVGAVGVVEGTRKPKKQNAAATARCCSSSNNQVHHYPQAQEKTDMEERRLQISRIKEAVGTRQGTREGQPESGYSIPSLYMEKMGKMEKMEASHQTIINLQHLDLYCLETTMEDEERQREEEMLMFWENDELLFLSSKQKNALFCRNHFYRPFLFSERTEGVNWLLMASRQLRFTAHTTILAVDYFDRFLSSEERKMEESQPWITQLCSVACLSLAAKLEEPHVPLLLDLQVGETRFAFNAKTIQRMELVVLSTLGWRMNPVTPLSFVDHIGRRLVATDEPRHWDVFQRACHSTLLSLITDSRWLEYLPSVLAAAAMIYVVEKLQLRLGSSNQILSLLNLTTEDADGCFQFLVKYLSND